MVVEVWRWGLRVVICDVLLFFFFSLCFFFLMIRRPPRSTLDRASAASDVYKRQNPITYVKAYDYIRDLFAGQQLSKIRGFMPKHFSFNVEGGRCETCKGEGEQVVELSLIHISEPTRPY